MTSYPNYVQRASAAAGALLLVVLAACNSGGGGGGGVNHDGRYCTLSGNNPFTGDGVVISPVDSKRQCPYTVVAVGSLVPFAFFIDIQANYIIPGSGAHLQVQDHSGVWRLDNYAYFSSVDPHDANKVRATTSGSYEGGHAGTDGQILDGAVIDYWSSRANAYAIGDLFIPGIVDPNHVNLIAPPEIGIGQAASFRIMPTWDTTSYEYAWDMNGTPIGSTATVITSVGSQGYFTIRGIAIRSGDYSADTVTKTYSTFLSGTITGPTTIKPNVSCSWSVAGAEGTPPYTYQWFWPISGSGQYLNYANSGSDFLLSVVVTDATGAQKTISEEVSLKSSAPICPS